MKFYKDILSVLVFAICVLIRESGQVSLEEDLTLTYSQKLLLDQFKVNVGALLTQPYMNRDIYLIRWLRARNFNLEEAETMLKEIATNLKWRVLQSMDTILTQDWSDFEKRFPYFIEGCDKERRPVASVSVGSWDVRSAVVSGQRDKVIRYFDKLMEEINALVRLAQDKGGNTTQYTLLFDMGNYNMIEQGCSTCIPVYLSLFTSYEQHYPGAVHKMILLNTPPIFQTLLALIRPLLSPLTRDALVVYGSNKAEWQSALLNEISEDQLTKPYGGNKEAGFEPEELRKLGFLSCLIE